MTDKIEVEREKLEYLALNIEGMNLTACLKSIEEMLNPIPTMTEEDWQRVVDDKFYVVSNDINEPFIMTRELNDIHLRKHFHVLREKGHRQPHFKGHSHPEGAVMVAVYYYGQSLYTTDSSRFINWDGVREYIVL